MKDLILKQKELIRKLNIEMEELKTFLIGNIPKEVDEVTKEECFTDAIKNNLNDLDYAVVTFNTIKEIIMGGRNE